MHDAGEAAAAVVLAVAAEWLNRYADEHRNPQALFFAAKLTQEPGRPERAIKEQR
jgi:hypothetical protein